MTKNELAWAVAHIQMANRRRPNTDVHLLLRDHTPPGVDLTFKDKQTIINEAQIGVKGR